MTKLIKGVEMRAYEAVSKAGQTAGALLEDLLEIVKSKNPLLSRMILELSLISQVKELERKLSLIKLTMEEEEEETVSEEDEIK